MMFKQLAQEANPSTTGASAPIPNSTTPAIGSTSTATTSTASTPSSSGASNSVLKNATATSATNADGSTTTTITYPDGYKLTLTKPNPVSNPTAGLTNNKPATQETSLQLLIKLQEELLQTNASAGTNTMA
jgi:vesicle coat complex subunit